MSVSMPSRYSSLAGRSVLPILPNLPVTETIDEVIVHDAHGARDLAREFLEPINLAKKTPEGTRPWFNSPKTVICHLSKNTSGLAHSTGTENMWKRYLEPRCQIMLRDFRTVDGEKLLEAIAKEHKLTSTTLAHIKAFLSGIFRFRQTPGCDQLRESNAGCSLAQGMPAGETHAYSLEEITQMLNVLPEPAATIVAIAAFTGVR